MPDQLNKLKRGSNNPMTPVKPTKKKNEDGNKASSSGSDSAGSGDVPPLKQPNQETAQGNGQGIITRQDIDQILSSLASVKSSQEGLKQSFEKRIDNLKKDLTDNFDEKFQDFKDNFTMDISRLDNKFTDLETRFERLASSTANDHGHIGVKAFDPTSTIVAYGIPYQRGENLGDKVQKLVNALKSSSPPGGDRVLQEANVINFLRMQERNDGKHPLVKIQFESLEQKIAILRCKQSLKNTVDFKRVFLRTSKSFQERVMEQNLQAIMKMIPDGDKLILNSSGHIVPKPPANPWRNRQEGNQTGGGGRPPGTPGRPGDQAGQMGQRGQHGAQGQDG